MQKARLLDVAFNLHFLLKGDIPEPEHSRIRSARGIAQGRGHGTPMHSEGNQGLNSQTRHLGVRQRGDLRSTVCPAKWEYELHFDGRKMKATKVDGAWLSGSC
jgi:hypothetical protein